jgi:mRNA interferase HigB
MRVISRRRLREFWDANPESETALKAWYVVAKKAKWASLADVRRTYPHADLVRIACSKTRVKTVVVFNIAGNNVRLITDIIYQTQCIYIKFVLTHPEYDREAWKGQICRE